MITENFKSIQRIALQSSSTGSGLAPVMDVNGVVYYACPLFNSTSGNTTTAHYPNGRTNTVSLSATTAGISFGIGGTEATASDYNLEETVTSGVVVNLFKSLHGYETESGSHYVEYYIAITNTTLEQLVIREVGYKQNLLTAPYIGSTSRSGKICLIDRTVLEKPLIIKAGDAGILVYKLRTPISSVKTVNGVKIVPWEFGSDEDITAMISAAHAGTIDLQEDAEWRIGMKRPIDIAAFTGGGDTAHAAQTIDLVITSFDDYENCGCVMQVDFDEALAEGQRMNSTNTTSGGYGESEMYTTTLPALVQALPQYIQDMLITFNVKSGAGDKSQTSVNVAENKLALRSLIEINGSQASTASGEGAYNEYFKTFNKTRRLGRTGSNTAYWTRSPSTYSAGSFHYITGSGTDGDQNTSGGGGSSKAKGLAPFACL